MKIYALGEQLIESTMEEILESSRQAVFIVSPNECKQVLEQIGIGYEGDISLEDAYFCKVETQQDCLYGTFAIPRLLDVLGSRYRIMFFIYSRYIVFSERDGFAERLIQRICRKKVQQGQTKEKFLYNFISEFMSKDSSILERFEREIMEMEDEIANDRMQNYQNHMMSVRKQLLILRGYYDQMREMGKAFEENENRFFAKKHLKYFGTISDRAERLIGKTIHLIDYAQQVRDAYKAQVDEEQNRNMQVLTIISTIFLPLTLITSWYGMNFKDMPELEHGYPFIIGLSISVIILCIIIFKKKKIL